MSIFSNLFKGFAENKNIDLEAKIKKLEEINNKQLKEIAELRKKLKDMPISKDSELNKMREVGFKQGYEKAESKFLLYKDTLNRIKKNKEYLRLIIKLIYYISEKEIGIEAQDYLNNLYVILDVEELKEIESFVDKLYRQEITLEEITEEMKKLDGATLFKLGQILNEVSTFNKLPISSNQIKRFKRAMECYDFIKNSNR